MSFIEALVLGVIQGITESLPVSSSGFLVIVPELFDWQLQSVSFDAIIHLGTLAAVIVGLFPEVRKMASGIFSRSKKDPWGRLAWTLLIATIPALVIGFFFADNLDSLFRHKEAVAISFIIWGAVLFIADRFATCQIADVTKVTWKKGLMIGFAQAIALIPGTSRSGITITAGLFGKLDRETAIRFSFLLGIPTIFAAGAYHVLELFTEGGAIEWMPLIVGCLSAFATGLLTIRLLLFMMRRASYASIAIFRIVLGIVLLVF